MNTVRENLLLKLWIIIKRGRNFIPTYLWTSCLPFPQHEALIWRQGLSEQICCRFCVAQDAIDNEDFGLDLPSAQKYQQNHHVQHDAVLAFQDELDKIKKLEVRFAASLTGRRIVRITD